MAVQQASLTIDSDPADLSIVRDFATNHAKALVDGIVYTTLALLVSEVAANAVSLDAGTVKVTLSRAMGGARLRVEVFDYGWGLPELIETSQQSSCRYRGRGLHLVDMLSTAWGVDQFLPGKSVWFELAPVDKS